MPRQDVTRNGKYHTGTWRGWVCCENDIDRGRRCGDNNIDCEINMLMLLS